MGKLSLIVPLFLCTVLCADAQQIRFRDITAQAGIHFVHNNGAFGKKYLPETMGPGCAFIDYDNDGWPDILLANGENWTRLSRPATTVKLDQHDLLAAFTVGARIARLPIPILVTCVALVD